MTAANVRHHENSVQQHHVGSAGARIQLLHTLPVSHRDYGGERMTLTILAGLTPYFDVTLLADDGLGVHERARAMGIRTQPTSGRTGLARAISGALRRNRRLVFMTSDMGHSALMIALNAVFHRDVAHIHLAHGGPEPGAYRRKKLLNHVSHLRIAAVSPYARGRLEAYGVRPDKISVISNFLPVEQQEGFALIAAQRKYGVPRRVVLLSHIEELKRLDLIFDALEAEPELSQLEFRILGDGPLLEEMQRRAERYPNVSFPGFVGDISTELADADLFLHCCPVEAFGLSILEAMAAGLPVLVPDAGGTRDVVIPDQTGLRFRANDATDMAAQLLALARSTPARRKALAVSALSHLQTDFEQEHRYVEYRSLIASLFKNMPEAVSVDR